MRAILTVLVSVGLEALTASNAGEGVYCPPVEPFGVGVLPRQTIAKEFTSDGIPTPRGKQIWSPSTVRSILANEKYKGDALLQKSFTTDFLTKP